MNTVLIIGASRGIGHEFARQYCDNGWSVIATARTDEALATLRGLGCRAIKLDVTDAAQITSLGDQLQGVQLKAAIINAGVYGPRTQGLDAVSAADFDAVMRTNVWAAMQLIPQIAPALIAGKGKLAVISSKMGSIGLRTSSSGWLYRASKAALNSVLKDASLVLGPQGVTCVSFHPGWVRTDMGGEGADLSVQESVSGMRQTLLALTPGQNGSTLNYDGEALAW
jgi:NAD(P)-dependent dehydrogenase (short-subunit alcohol dehydrogenase family)